MIVTPSMCIFVLMYFYSFLMVMSSDDWFLVWMGLEINMMSFLFIIYSKMSMYNIELCLKYFFVQSLGSVLFISFIYLMSESWSYLSSLILSYKLGAGPFYFWFPSVASGLSWVSVYLLMSIQKILPLMLLVMFMSWVIWILLAFSLIAGTLGSFNQTKMKILFSYSSIHHLGWLLICEFMDNGMWMIYLLLYSVMMMFIINVLYYYNVDDFVEIMKWKSKWWFVMMMMGVAGMPPMLGFFLKWMAFYYILNMNYFIVMVMVVLSVVMFYVYVRVLYDVLMGSVKNLSWCYVSYNKLYFFSMDYMIVLGLLVSGMFSLIFLM